MTTIILGWDGLDPELLARWGLGDAFGEVTRSVETYSNPSVGIPHTRELWPTIITGLTPAEHGIRVTSPDSDSVAWESPWLDRLSNVANGLVPQHLRARIGERLRERGAELAVHGPDYYRENGIRTVFDGRRTRPISVPNYRLDTPAGGGELDKPRQRQADLLAEDGPLWAPPAKAADQMADTRLHPTPVLDEHFRAKASKRLGVVEAALQREYDLVFAWLGYIDGVGHIAPLVDEDGWQRRHYEAAARDTRRIRALARPEDTVLCVSDHGLQHGSHTHDAAVCGPAEVVGDATELTDVARIIDDCTGSRAPVGGPPVREAYRRVGSGGDQTTAEVREHLEDLGYA